MSLNGLDDAKVTEAYQSSLVDAGGWFLLKYASRDEVDIYKRGSRGVAEARTAIEEYEDKSPLYGFLVYRRRKVLLKYIPEGTSRLLQARVAVHFTSFEEKFTPYDTVFALTSYIELTEAALSQACSLHSAADSTRSSGGSGQRKSRLDEIVEDPKERPSYDARAAQEDRTTEKPGPKPVNVPTIVESGPVEKRLPPLPDDLETRPGTRESALPGDLPLASRKAAAVLGIPVSSVRSNSIESVTKRPTTPVHSGDAASIYAATLNSVTRSEYLAYLGDDARTSTSTTRPSISDLDFANLYKPKVKLGPRPSVDASKASSGPRPVSSLPPGLRAAPRKQVHNQARNSSSNRPTSRQSLVNTTIIEIPPPPPIPESPQMPTFMRPSSSPASVKSLPATLASKGDKMTKEKRRLMKAVEMRKKQMQAAKSQPTTPTRPELPPIPNVSEVLASSSKEEAMQAPETHEELPEKQHDAPTQQAEIVKDDPFQDTEKARPTETKEQEAEPESDPEPRPEDFPSIPTIKAPATETTPPKNPSRASGDHLKADSGIQIEVEKASHETEEDQGVLAQSSSPVSVEQSSELPSTRPSSMSETGDEGTIADIWSKEAEEVQREEKQPNESQETIPAEGDETPPASIAEEPQRPETAEEEHQPELTEVEPKEPAEEGEDTIQPEATSADEGDASSDITPTEKSIVHANDGRLTVTFPERKDSIKDKRKAMIRPLSMETSHAITDESEVDVSDDEFMVELRNAEVQEAKPVHVSKSPLTTVFPALRPTTITTISTPRSFSSPAASEGGPAQTPRSASDNSLNDISPPRSASATRLNLTPNQPQTISVAKKVNISSGISQRIKALARNSGSNEQPVDRVSSRESTGPSIVALRKSSLRDATPPQRPQSSTTLTPNRERVSSMSKTARASSPEPFPSLKPEPRPHESIQAVYNVQQRSDHRQSISVTARIVRDSRTEKPTLAMPTQSTPLELHESPLVIEHKRAASVPKLEIPIDRIPVRSPDGLSPAASPNRETLSPSSPLPRSSSDNWRSTITRHARRASEARSPTSMVRSMSSTSLDTMGSRESDSTPDKIHDRKGSRSSRMLKRMSNSISLGRKTLAEIVSPKINEEAAESTFPERVSEERSRPQNPYTVEIGDLNVQLPDTLLWKRRWVEIDGDGYLVVKMSKSNQMANTKNITKKYHLSELRRPFLPDQERQEMPNSVVLDFVDGRTLQCACETGGGQVEVLRLLQEAHEQWSSSQPR